jgi:hypothetical protein
MRIRTTFIVAMTAVCLVALAPPAAPYALRGGVLGNGATPADGANGAIGRLLGTVGQWAVGASAGANTTLCHGYWCFGGARVVAVGDDPPTGERLPTELSFGLPRPNPASGLVTFALALPAEARVDLTIYDLQGRVTDAVIGHRMAAGWHNITWQGRGAGARAGVYFARLAVDGRHAGLRRITLLP